MTKKNAGNTSELPLRHIFIEPQVFYKQWICFSGQDEVQIWTVKSSSNLFALEV